MNKEDVNNKEKEELHQNDHHQQQHIFKAEFLAGATSGAITRMIVAPLDVVKIRFQLQKHDTKIMNHNGASLEYRGIFQTLGKISREEGLRALWKGNLTAEILWISYGAIQFTSYSALIKILDKDQQKEKDKHYKPPTSISLLAGGASSALATLLSYPFDTIRTNIVSQKHKVTIFSCLKELEKNRSIYNGVLASLSQIVPLMALQFTFYEALKNTYIQLRTRNGSASTHEAKTDAIGHFISGGLSGALSKFMVLPLDVIKKRLQIQHPPTTMRSMIVSMFRLEGWRSFFKGGVPSLVKAGLSSSLSFMMYEQSKIIITDLISLKS